MIFLQISLENVALSNDHPNSDVVQHNIHINPKHRLPEDWSRPSETGTIGNYKNAEQTKIAKSIKIIIIIFPLKIIGAICVGIIAWYYNRRYYDVPDLFFLLMATTFLIGTFCLLVSCLFSLSTGGIISKTIYVTIWIHKTFFNRH